MDRIIQKKKGDMILAEGLRCGTNGSVEFSMDIMRLGFFRSIAELCVVPLLHRNSINFMGMSKPEDYLCYKTVNDDL